MCLSGPYEYFYESFACATPSFSRFEPVARRHRVRPGTGAVCSRRFDSGDGEYTMAAFGSKAAGSDGTTLLPHGENGPAQGCEPGGQRGQLLGGSLYTGRGKRYVL